MPTPDAESANVDLTQEEHEANRDISLPPPNYPPPHPLESAANSRENRADFHANDEDDEFDEDAKFEVDRAIGWVLSYFGPGHFPNRPRHGRPRQPVPTTIDLTEDDEGPSDLTRDGAPVHLRSLNEPVANRVPEGLGNGGNVSAPVEPDSVEILSLGPDVIEIPDESPVQDRTKRALESGIERKTKRQRLALSSKVATSSSRTESDEQEIQNTKVISDLASKLTCSICQYTIAESKSPLTSTVCGHLFCQRCIRKAVRVTKSCPTCRKSIKLKDVHRVYF